MRSKKNISSGKPGETPVFKRIILKLSGEALSGEGEQGLCFERIQEIAEEIAEVHRLGVDIAIVIGGGNIFRGITGSATGAVDRATGDYMGMLATLINALALQDALEKRGVATRVLSALEVKSVAEPYIRRRAIRHLEKSRVVIFACGTGNPFFTTDTAASLRAAEIHAEAILKATKVDGVYDRDPKKDKGAVKFEEITFHEALTRNLKVMDPTAVSMLRELKIPVYVFNIWKKGSMKQILLGHDVGTKMVAGGM